MKSLTSIHPSNFPVIDPPPTHPLIFPHVHLPIHLSLQTPFIHPPIHLSTPFAPIHPSILTDAYSRPSMLKQNNVENQFPALKEPTIHPARQDSGQRMIYFLCQMCTEKGHLTQCEEVRNACTVLFELSLKFN